MYFEVQKMTYLLYNLFWDPQNSYRISIGYSFDLCVSDQLWWLALKAKHRNVSCTFISGGILSGSKNDDLVTPLTWDGSEFRWGGVMRDGLLLKFPSKGATVFNFLFI